MGARHIRGGSMQIFLLLRHNGVAVQTACRSLTPKSFYRFTENGQMFFFALGVFIGAVETQTNAKIEFCIICSIEISLRVVSSLLLIIVILVYSLSIQLVFMVPTWTSYIPMDQVWSSSTTRVSSWASVPSAMCETETACSLTYTVEQTKMTTNPWRLWH